MPRTRNDAPLFNPATRASIKRRTSRGLALVFAGTTVVVGAIVGLAHSEEPFLPHWLGLCPPEVPFWDCEYHPVLDWLAGLGATLAFGLFVFTLFRFRRIPPSVTCERCRGRGWIADLEPTGGRCPACGHDRFRFFAIEPTGIPIMKIWRLKDTDGRDLLALRQQNSHFF